MARDRRLDSYARLTTAVVEEATTTVSPPSCRGRSIVGDRKRFSLMALRRLFSRVSSAPATLTRAFLHGADLLIFAKTNSVKVSTSSLSRTVVSPTVHLYCAACPSRLSCAYHSSSACSRRTCSRGASFLRLAPLPAPPQGLTQVSRSEFQGPKVQGPRSQSALTGLIL